MDFRGIEVSQLGYSQLRRQFRKEAVESLRVREGMKSLNGVHWVGVRKGRSLEKAVAASTEGFVVPESEGLERELQDLVRDAEVYEKASAVSHLQEESPIAKTFTPGMQVDLENEDEILAWTENYNKEQA